MSTTFKGTGVAMVTPFSEEGNIDFTCVENLIEHLISGGVDYVVVMGTTGESATLNEDEKQALLSFTVETVNKRVPVVLGLGGYNTQNILNGFKTYDFEGVDAILSVSPYYNKPTQRGLYQHYKIISNASPVPVILYNVPGRTAVNITAETTLRLAHDMNNIIGIKEASGNLVQCMEIIRNRPEGFLLISGDDVLTLPLISIGADGCISVIANAFPSEFSEMISCALDGNQRDAREIHYRLLELTQAIFEEGNPAGIKAALEILHKCPDHLRLPLVSVSRGTFRKIETLIEEFKRKK